ncbi:dihydroorotate dehydrogenase electron transfer subunit [Salimicrobium halophilum]|uniref:Dihydroorotate dehydrogenase B (NAD(+)), electron transfer subunit n=1 Tax=Salimicrobium halophilum TaxID=86666 RepID=A0A1G8QGD2_9BACI|nr:dihydroorotate dehydrogenase electron transfer subunit [Salimicrobium halophilum]SDJ03140.1 dihydroorotate oxidase B, electron transfer subunit [Salimicrobium halophilum]
MKLLDVEVTENRKLAEDTYEMTVATDASISIEQPGQFVHVLVDPPHYLRRPLSIASWTEDTLTFVYKTFGPGTKTLTNKRRGDEVNLLGPLGNGFPLPEDQHVLLIGGGVGVPPMKGLAEELSRTNNNVSAVLGFRSEAEVFYERELSAFADVTIVTEDGSYGKSGLVTEWLGKDADIFYACGPNGMLKAVTKTLEVPGYISMEERMGCAIGACFACTMETCDGGYVNVCKDGPVFPKDKVVLP